MKGILGKKVGMTSLFDERGNSVPCTVIEAGPCVITQIKTAPNDGYSALQVGYDELTQKKAEKRLSKPELGHLKKAGVYMRTTREFRMADTSAYTVGQRIGVQDVFNVGDTVKVISTSKGRGFQGVVKRHHFSGVGSTTHGQSDRVRAPGSIGSSSYPSRVFKGQRMAGRMGHTQITTRNLRIVRIVEDGNLLVVSGSIAGAPNELVRIEKI
jgi:large subunit ribosomal protein L3